MVRASQSKSKSVEVMEVDETKNGDASEVEEGAQEGEEEQGEGEEDEEEEEGEGEYEVEAILDHKQKSGKFIYLVSWRGYGPEHNTWEPEEHVSHAEIAVTKYWDSRPKRVIKKPNETAKRGRQSASSSQRPAKASRSNGSSSRKHEPIEVDDNEDEVEEQTFEETHVDSTDKYKDIQDWEELVQTVDTIERGPDETLLVYLTMTGGERIVQAAEVVYRRCPQKILAFYESHLKWRNADAV